MWTRPGGFFRAAPPQQKCPRHSLPAAYLCLIEYQPSESGRGKKQLAPASPQR